MTKRTLSLKRDELSELTSDELSGVVGGVTQLSCLAYVSCFATACLIPTNNGCE